MPQMSEEEFTSKMGDGMGEDNEDDVHFMSMKDFKDKLDAMSSSQKWDAATDIFVLT